MTTMEYKGYVGVIEVDSERKVLHGSIVNTRDVITFEGRNVEELEQALADSVEDYLEFCRAHHREPEKPASGRFVVRIDPAMHRELMRVAARADKSLNTVVREAIERHLMGNVGSAGDDRRARYALHVGRRAVAESTTSRSKLAAKKRKATPARDTITSRRRS
jgi:predicted HicB family RNase H-like nuclease